MEIRLSVIPLALVVVFASPVSIRADDFNEQFLVAACAPQAINGRLASTVVNTPNGVGVAHHPRATGDVVFYCQIDADESNFFNWIQIVAEDNSAGASATATLFRQRVGFGFAPPEALFSVTTSDQAGVQTASNFFGEATLNEYDYVYWIEVRLSRATTAAELVVYSVGLMDVF